MLSWFLSLFPIKQPEQDIERVDLYLKKWDEFAQSGPDPRYHLGRNFGYFEAALVNLFETEDDRAFSRFVFYQLVQVGGFIEVDTPLGRAFRDSVKEPCPFADLDEGPLQYFAGDLYWWWMKHKGSYPSMRLMEEWLEGDFAQNTALKFYEGSRPSP